MLPAGYRIRLARHDEVPLLIEIERLAAKNFAPYGLEQIMSEALDSSEFLQGGVHNEQMWVAVDTDDRPVGLALAIVIDNHAHLDELDVLPDHGRRGLGRALVETVCNWARDQGFKAITLSTMRDIPWNAPFYAKHGFRVLAPDELSETLQELMREETAEGMPGDRVMMRRKL